LPYWWIMYTRKLVGKKVSRLLIMLRRWSFVIALYLGRPSCWIYLSLIVVRSFPFWFLKANPQ